MSVRDPQTRAETVGSLLRSDAALRAARGEGDDPAAVLDAAVRDVISTQESAGLDVITDGELRRSNWADTTDYLDCFAKTSSHTGGLQWRGGTAAAPTTTAPATYSVVVRRVSEATHTGDRLAAYEFLARNTSTRTKFTMPAPSYHRRYWLEEMSREAYDSVEDYLYEIRDMMRGLVDRLIALGCDYVQLDGPNYGSMCDPDNRARLEANGVDIDAQLEFDAALDNSLFDGVHRVTRALHICRGNSSGGSWHSTGGYGAISSRLFPNLEFDRLLLEYDTDRAGTFGPLADVKPGVVAVLGLLTTKSGELEDAAIVRERIREAAELKPLEELAISTQCGFASVATGNPVTPEQQHAKLALVGSIARAVWG